METAGGREISDAERCRKRALEVRRRGSLIPNRTQAGRREGKKVSDRCDGTRALSEHSARVFLHKNDVSLKGVLTEVVI